jgi:hypothetical protein
MTWGPTGIHFAVHETDNPTGRPSRPMSGRFGRRRWGRDPERAFIASVRWALLPGVGLPLVVAGLGSSASGSGPPLILTGPLTAIVLIVNVACWLRIVARWRAMPPDDDGWWQRWWQMEGPLDPWGGGPGGVEADWAAFEREFRAHVEQRERELVPV